MCFNKFQCTMHTVINSSYSQFQGSHVKNGTCRWELFIHHSLYGSEANVQLTPTYMNCVRNRSVGGA